MIGKLHDCRNWGSSWGDNDISNDDDGDFYDDGGDSMIREVKGGISGKSGGWPRFGQGVPRHL